MGCVLTSCVEETTHAIVSNIHLDDKLPKALPREPCGTYQHMADDVRNSFGIAAFTTPMNMIDTILRHKIRWHLRGKPLTYLKQCHDKRQKIVGFIVDAIFINAFYKHVCEMDFAIWQQIYKQYNYNYEKIWTHLIQTVRELGIDSLIQQLNIKPFEIRFAL